MSNFGSSAPQQGKFTSDGTTKILSIRSDVDWMWVYNYTQATATVAGNGVKYYWQRGMAAGTGIEYYKSGGTDALNMTVMATGGFTLFDSSSSEFAAPVAITSSTNATQPSFLVASTAALATGDKVRVAGMAGQTNLNGLEFEIEVVDATHFRPRYVLATAPGVGGTGGYYYVRNFDNPFQPINYKIFNVTSASQAVVRLNRQPISSDITDGDIVRLWFPDSSYGQWQNISGYSAKVLSVSGAELTLDLDTSSLAAFTFPLPANVPYSIANMTVVGSDSANTFTNFVDYSNSGYIGMKLPAGVDSPGGANADVIYWVAGTSFRIANE